MLDQATCVGGRTAQAQEGHLGVALQQVVERAEVGQQRRRGLGADTRHAGDVVDRVPGQAEVVRDLVGMHAVPVEHALVPPALVARIVPLHVPGLQQLREILVGGHDHAATSGRAKPGHGRADQVVGLEAAVHKGGQADRLAEFPAMQELPLERLRGRVPVGLVGRVEFVAEA